MSTKVDKTAQCQFEIFYPCKMYGLSKPLKGKKWFLQHMLYVLELNAMLRI